MAQNLTAAEKKRAHEKRIVRLMIGIYCCGNHGTKRGELCPECTRLADYADARVDRCPDIEDKTFCSNCPHPCYKPDMREQIRVVMRYAGPRMIFHRPVMAIKHVIAMRSEQARLAKK